jgi:N-acetylglucosaminyldiphosphoundecaprenol N-acetyl-beta-D-mannosaminyltransferase
MVDPVPALTLFGVPIHDVSLPETLEWVARWIAGQRPRQIATVNPEFLMAARRDPTFRAVLQGAGLCVPDGVGVTLAARYLGRPLRERVAGVDLVERLAAHAADAGWRLFLLGGAPGIAERAGAVLTGRHPTLTICGTYAGSPAVEDEEEILQRVRTARADVLLVAYGAPAQDLWLARNLARSGAKVGIGIGGALDYLAGVVPRAPRWVRRLGFEWLYRLIRQPWRWRRQRVLPQFALLVLLRRC